MDQLTLKYNKLNEFSKKEISDFLDFLLSKEVKNKKTKTEEYKREILKVSTWTEDEITDLEKNIKYFGRWNIQEW
jgi:hypothetical protein